MKNFQYILFFVFFTLFLPPALQAEKRKTQPPDLTVRDYFIEAVHLYCIPDIGRAEALFRKVVSMEPDFDAAWFYLGNISEMKKDNISAEECYLKASGGDSTNFWYKAALADLYSSTGRNDDAISIYEEIHTGFPKRMTPQSCYLLGEYYMSEKKDSLAIPLYEKSLRLDPNYSPAHFSIAETYRVSSRYYDYFQHMNVFLADSFMNPQFKSRYLEEVILNPQFVSTFKPQVDTMILNTLSAHPADSSVLLTAGSYYLRTDEKEKGMDFLRRDCELFPESRHIAIEYISVLYYMEKWEELLARTKKTISLFPHDETLPEILAVAYWQTKDTTNALSTYLSQLRMTRNPKIRLSCCTAIGDLYQETGKPKKAEAYYKKGLKIDSCYTPLLNNYAYFLTKVGRDYQKGLRMSRKTIQADPDNPTYLDTYGWLLYLTGDYTQAKAQFKRAFLFGGKEQAVILDHYGDVLWALKDYDMAVIYWEQADKLDPSLDISVKIAEHKSSLKK